MDYLQLILATSLVCGIIIAFLWIASLLVDAHNECERQRKALTMAFRQMAQPGLYQICDNTCKAMNETLNGGKDGE